jgi:hypothetical protein
MWAGCSRTNQASTPDGGPVYDDGGVDGAPGDAGGDGASEDAGATWYTCSPGSIAGEPLCPAGHVCYFFPGHCPWPAGFCVPRPEECPEEVDEVCGCDNVTYANECLARQAGTSVLFHDRCDRTCTTNDDCEPDELCGNTERSEASDWCVVEGEGRCMSFSPMCEFIEANAPENVVDFAFDYPVCGCDGTTYANACEAAVEGRTHTAAYQPCETEDGGV